jgi:cell division protein FtsB
MPTARPATATPRRQTRARSRPAARAGAARRSPLRIRWDRVGRVVLLVVLVVVAGLYLQRGLALLAVHNQADQQRSIVQRLVRENAQLARQAAVLNNPAAIQRDARALGMVRPGERSYVVTGLPPN